MVPAAAALAPRATQDGAVLGAVRRQMEALEEKFGCQLSEMRRNADRPREAALARLEEKISTAESSSMKLDLRLSELTGNVRGLSEEMQTQIRRVDLVEDRLSEWRHQIEEEIRQKYVDIEQSIQKATSNFRVNTSVVEDAQKRHQQRLQKLEADVAEAAAEEKRTQEGLLAAHARLDAVEDRQMDDAAALEQWRAASKPAPGADAGGGMQDAALLALLEKRVGDVADRVSQVVQDSFDLHAAMSAQEEQLRTLRTLAEAREDHWRAVGEQIERGDWANKLEKLRDASQEEAKLRVQHLEEVQMLQRKMEFQEQSHEEVRSLCEQLASDPSVTMAVEECRSRIEESEARLAAFDSDLHAARTAAQLAPRVSALVAQLQELVPRVTEQEAAIRELREGRPCTNGNAR